MGSSDKTTKQLEDYSEGDKVVPIGELREHIKELDKNSVKMYSGFTELDNALDGFNTGELIVLSGGVKTGKTLMMKTMIDNFFQAGITSVVFSYEESLNYFMDGFENGGEDLLFFTPKILKAYDVDWIVDRTKESRQKYGTRLCFIDHGSFIMSPSTGGGQSISLQIGEAVRKLKRMAVEESMVVFLVWHIYKFKVESAEDLDQSLLRDSGMVAAECDTVLMTYRDAKSDGIVSSNESGVMICVSRRTGQWHRYIATIKKGKYIYECEFTD